MSFVLKLQGLGKQYTKLCRRLETDQFIKLKKGLHIANKAQASILSSGQKKEKKEANQDKESNQNRSSKSLFGALCLNLTQIKCLAVYIF